MSSGGWFRLGVFKKTTTIKTIKNTASAISALQTVIYQNLQTSTSYLPQESSKGPTAHAEFKKRTANQEGGCLW